MRTGVLIRGEVAEVERLAAMGFRSMEWMRFANSGCAPEVADWKPYAEELAEAAKARDVRISAIGALYANPLHPAQAEKATAVLRRAVDVAAHIGVRTVAGFAGGVVELQINERGGNAVYKPFDGFVGQMLGFWEPIALFASEKGVRIAFENCPQAPFRLPVMGFNMMAHVGIWEKVFNETRCDNIGLEWDPSHLVCQLIDPVENIRKFGSKIFHVHAKDAVINHELARTHGICHPGVLEHRVPGLGQCDWGEIVRALLRAGYDSDLNIEGWHDPLYRDHPPGEAGNPLAGRQWETTGWLLGKQTLEKYTRGTE